MEKMIMSNRVVSPGPFLITTAPSLTTCRRCKRLVLAATVGGLDRHVDPATLNDAGELQALLDGRRTYHLVTEDYLIRRTVHHIGNVDLKRPVLADHNCKEVPDHQIEHAWSLAAKALITGLLGGTVIAEDGVDSPPPF